MHIENSVLDMQYVADWAGLDSYLRWWATEMGRVYTTAVNGMP